MNTKIQTAIENYIKGMDVMVFIDGRGITVKPDFVEMSTGTIQVSLDLGLKGIIEDYPGRYDAVKHGFIFDREEIDEFKKMPF